MAQTTLQVINNNGSLNFDYSANHSCISSEYNIQSSGNFYCDIVGNITTQNHSGNISLTSDIGTITLDSNASLSNAIIIEATNSNGGILNIAGVGGYNVITSNGNISLQSQGADIDIGVSAINTPANLQTQNVNIESFNTLNMNSADMYFISSDVISFVSNTGDIQFGTTSNSIPVIKFQNENVLINQESSNLDYQLDIAVSHPSSVKPGYNGLVINSFESNVASDLTLQTSNTLGDGTQCILSMGSFGNDNSYSIFQNYLAYQTGNVVIRLDGPSYSPNASYLGFGIDFSSQDIGRNIYWTVSQRQDTIISLGTYITLTNDTSNVNVSGNYTGNNSRVYLLQIDSITTPNTFKWSNNGGSTFQYIFIPIVLTPITLDSGLQVTFTKTTGFVINQQFTFQTKITAIVNNIISQPTIPEEMYTLQPFYSYIKTSTPSDIVIKTNENEKLRITGDGSIGIQQNMPKACLDLNSNYSKVLLVNQINSGYQNNPSISQLNSGGYIIVWNAQLSPNGTTFNNYGQRYLTDGSQYGNNFIINNTIITNQSFPSVAGNRLIYSNHYIIAWTNLDTTITPNLNKVYCQIYHNNLPIRTQDIQLDSTNPTTSNQLYPRVAGLYNGNYIIVWNADDTNAGSGIYSVKGIIISDSGNIIVSKFQISSSSPPNSLYNATYAYVAGLPNDDVTVPNGFVVSFMTALDNTFNPRYTIAVRIMNPNGTPYSNQIPITALGNSAISSISDGLVSVAEINLQQVNSVLGNGGFIIAFYRNYLADISLYNIGDNVIGLTSGATATIQSLDSINRIITLQYISNRFLISEEIQIISSIPNVGNIIEKIAGINFLTLTTANITLNTGSKNVVAYRYNSNMTQASDAIWNIQVNTSELFSDLDRESGNVSIFKYTRPLAAVTLDNIGSACITWSNGSIPSVYYQLIDITNGSYIDVEQRLTSQYDGLKQRNQVVAPLQSIEGSNYGFIISWDNQNLNLLDTGIYQQLIGYNHSIINLVDGNSNFIFNHQDQCGIGTNSPQGNLHIMSQNTSGFNDPANPVSVIIQNTCQHIVTNSNIGLQNISFLDGSSNVLNVIKSSNSLRYDDLYPLPENLIGFYKFDETQGTQAKDSSSASTFLLNNSPVYINTSAILMNFDIENCWNSGLINNSLLFNGDKDYLFIENSAPNNLNIILETNNQLSLALWINIPSSIVQGSSFDIVSNGGQFNIPGTYLLGLSDSTNTSNINLIANVSVSNVSNFLLVNNISIIGNNILNDNKWHYIVMTVLLDNTNNCTINLFVDGILDNTITSPGIINQVLHGSYNTYIGSKDGSFSNIYRGYMDELRFYNTVLSTNLITQLYNYGNPNIPPKGSLIINANNNTSHNLGLVLDDTGKLNNLSSRPLPYTIITGELIAFSSNTTIYGIETQFTTELTIGDIISFNVSQNNTFLTQEFTIITIENDTLLTLNLPGYDGPESQKPYQSVLRRPSIYTFFDNGDNIKGHIDNYGNMIIGTGKPSTMLEICGQTTNSNNSPEVTITNTSIENTLYSRYTAINFRGYDTSNNLGTAINLAHIETSHDGTGIDNKGTMRFFTNNGIQEKNVISLNSEGYVGIGGQNLPLTLIHATSQDTSNECAMILQSNYNASSNNNSIFDERSYIYFAGLTSITETTNVNVQMKVLSAISGSNDSNNKILDGRLDFLTNNDENPIKNGIESRMSITHTGSVGINILNPPNQFTVAPELRISDNSINTISMVNYDLGLNISTITINNNIFPNTLESKNLLIGSTCIINNAVLTTGTILTIININQFTVANDFSPWIGNNIYINYPGLNVSGTNGYIGINTSTMNSPLSIYGAISKSITTITSNITLDASHHTILCTGSSITITLPSTTFSDITGRIYTIKKISHGTSVVIDGNSAYIDNNLFHNLSGNYAYITLQCDGTNWWIIG